MVVFLVVVGGVVVGEGIFWRWVVSSGAGAYSPSSDLAGSGVKPSSDSALRDASSDSARARISSVASKALLAEAAESEADAWT